MRWSAECGVRSAEYGIRNAESSEWLGAHQKPLQKRFLKKCKMKNFSLSILGPLLILLVVSQLGCYTFKGISIDPNVKTFAVRNFETLADNAPPTLGLEFAELLRDKTRSETPLKAKNEEPDIEFTGKIVDFRVSPVNPKPGELVAANRLEVRIRVGYINRIDEKKGWAAERDFQHFADFSSSTDLLAVQANLLSTINKQLLEDIFNAAFNDW